MTISSALTHAEAERLGARIAELEHERKHLLAVIEILKEISGSLHFIDILQSIARKLGSRSGSTGARSFSLSAVGRMCGSWPPTRTRRSGTISWTWSATRS
jgi:hypothetical protein